MKKLGFLFPGQGSQYVGMGQSLYDEYSVARETFEEAEDALGFDLKSLCFTGSMDELTQTANAQPAILTVSIAAYRVLMQELKLAPSLVAGHSLGEFSALVSTGALAFSDAVKIVRQRGILMQEAVAPGAGAMLAVVGSHEREVEEVCQQASSGGVSVGIANYNSSEQLVISGHTPALEKAEEELNRRGIKTIRLKVGFPFHTNLMRSAAGKFRDELERYDYGRFQWPVLSNVTATPYTDRRYIISNLTSQMAQPVQWYKSVQYMLNQGVNHFIEIGPKTVLRNLMTGITFTAQSFAFEHPSGLELLRNADMEYKPDGLGLVTSCIAIAVSTQNRNWNNDEYEQGVVVPYKELQNMREQLIATGTEPTIEQMQQALDKLKSIFETKLTPAEQRAERFEQIFSNTHTRELFPAFQVS
ncbi:ACP S-malonyltransferase [Paenibacillus polymyxa]|uniref:ACP S-malonyltransferase n=1 Tax=Paenibacillus polymyxa TaxID=1406 RepID=UPI00201869BE|nr:ACP S-malonyltransferase [Paenibacillus polymyxa]UQQ36467.1 ACP S-malonyltransferase [Paenibacillus polymyxa]